MKITSLLLVIICIVVFVIQIMFPVVTNIFLLDSSSVLSEPWTLITSIFIHGGFEHLVFNMFALGLFGFILENIIGSKKFLAVFFIGGLFSSIVSIFFYSASLGASGAIFSVIGVLAVIRYRMIVWFFGVPMPMAIAAAFWAIVDIVGVFYPSNTANMAHLAGLFFGLVLSYFLREYMDKGKKRKKALSDEDIDKWEDSYMRNK